MKQQGITGLTLLELTGLLAEEGQQSFHAKQIYNWIYKKGILDFSSMSDLPAGLRKRLEERFSIAELKLVKTLCSQDKTTKHLFRLPDNSLIESVIIPTRERVTACISTQAGCKLSCKFCASGLLGFVRNLNTAEIVEQVLQLKNFSKDRRITHIVFMGIGEPLDNYSNVIKAIRIINSKEGLNIGARRITISTCGIIPGIEKLQDEGLQIELSISLHAPCDEIRSRIMPINKKYPIKKLMGALRRYIKSTNRQVTFEYILIKDLNSDLQSAQLLSTILKGLNCKVNLIPANTIKEFDIFAPSKSEALLFKETLLRNKVNVTLRRPRGQDIEAACGQLRLRYEKS